MVYNRHICLRTSNTDKHPELLRVRRAGRQLKMIKIPFCPSLTPIVSTIFSPSPTVWWGVSQSSLHRRPCHHRRSTPFHDGYHLWWAPPATPSHLPKIEAGSVRSDHGLQPCVATAFRHRDHAAVLATVVITESRRIDGRRSPVVTMIATDDLLFTTMIAIFTVIAADQPNTFTVVRGYLF